MKLSIFKNHLASLSYPRFKLPDGNYVPPHYHVTEIGIVTKKYIDCGGQMRDETVVSFQLWYADDVDHRLSADKLQQIIDIFEQKISPEDYPIEVDYQSQTIGKYGVERDEDTFTLMPKQTDCLAKDKCGILEQEQKSCCGTGGCC